MIQSADLISKVRSKIIQLSAVTCTPFEAILIYTISESRDHLKAKEYTLNNDNSRSTLSEYIVNSHKLNTGVIDPFIPCVP